MEEKITYLTRAEDGYNFLKFAYDSGRTYDAMGYLSHNICESFFKHLIDTYCKDTDLSTVLRAHSLRVLKKFLKKNLPDFICRWDDVFKCDGLYYSARYPGCDAVVLDAEDIEDCWCAVLETRNSVMNYLESRETQPSTVKLSSDVVEELHLFPWE